MSGDRGASLDWIDAELRRRAAGGLHRALRWVTSAQDSWVELEGRRVLMLCSNNYLGLANHPALVAAACAAARDHGLGAGASRLISGSMRAHQELEERLAAFKGTEAALLFNSGYHANVGAVAVPEGAARLRATTMATHSLDDIDYALDAFTRLQRPEAAAQA